VSRHPTLRRSIGTRIKIGHDDPTLTGHAGLLLTGELIRRLQARRCGHVLILPPDLVSRRRQDLVIVRATWLAHR
jgi:hypothetical protein